MQRRLAVFAALCVSALLGALFGSLCFINTDGRFSGILEAARSSCLDARRSGSLVKMIGSSLMSTGFYLFVAYMLGFSAMAQPFEFLLPFLKGMTVGVVLTSIYGGSITGSSLLSAAAVYPGALLSVIVTVLASREAVFLSSRLFGICFHNRLYDGLLERSVNYSVKFAELLAVSSIAALIDCLLAVIVFGRM